MTVPAADEDEAVREAAAEALRLMATDEADFSFFKVSDRLG